MKEENECPDLHIIFQAEKTEIEATKALCLPYKGMIPADGNIYWYEFSPNCLILVSATDFFFGNRVLGAGLDDELTEKLVKELTGFFRSVKRPRYFLSVCPPVITDNTGEIISRNKGNFLSNWIKLMKPVNEVVSIQNNIITRKMKEDERDFVSEFLVDSFSFPSEIVNFCRNGLGKRGWTCYVAISGDRIGGTASVFIDKNIAELGIAATIESERGKGIQSALIAKREQFAIKKKCEYIFVETAEPTPKFRGQSYLNMKRLGYKELYRRGNYAFQL
jgi:GNAT superfamily N-acetyltransferase